MSSLAQDELGHAAALYGLLAELTGTRPRRHRLRPRARRVPPLPAARPRPGRLGDDDRPSLPLRHGRCGPSRGARRRVVGAARRPRRQARARGALPPDARRRLARPAGPDRRRGARPPAGRARRNSAPDAATVFTPLPEEPALLEAGILAADSAELEGRWRAAIAPTFERLDLPMPPPARDPERGRLDHGEAFRWLWGEFTMVRRSDPGATW